MEVPDRVRTHPCSKTHFFRLVVPVGVRGVDAARQLEGLGIELEDGDAAEAVGVGIEDLVVVNVVVLAENPLAIGLQVGLRRLALDLVAQDLLPLVGVRNVELVEDEHGRGEDAAHHDHRKSRAIDADAGGLHGRQLTRFLQQAEGDQHRQQHASGAIR